MTDFSCCTHCGPGGGGDSHLNPCGKDGCAGNAPPDPDAAVLRFLDLMERSAPSPAVRKVMDEERAAANARGAVPTVTRSTSSVVGMNDSRAPVDLNAVREARAEGYVGATCTCGSAWFTVQAVTLDLDGRINGHAAPITCVECGEVIKAGAWASRSLSSVPSDPDHPIEMGIGASMD